MLRTRRWVGFTLLSAVLPREPLQVAYHGIRSADVALRSLAVEYLDGVLPVPLRAKLWALVDAAGCRGLRIGDAQVSEKHCNFLLNLGNATSAEIEELGDEVRRRVHRRTNVLLEWEIQRIGVE